MFAAELAAKSPPARRAAAQKLIDEAQRTSMDDATRFVLLSDARDIAVAGADVPDGWVAVNDLADRFTIDGPGAKLEMLQRVRKSEGSLESARIASKCSLDLALTAKAPVADCRFPPP